MADVGIRGVKVVNDADAVRLYQPDADGTMGGSAMLAPPAVVDLGGTIEIRNFITDFKVRRTTSTLPYTYSIQSSPTPQNIANPNGFRSAAAVEPAAGWLPESFITDLVTDGPGPYVGTAGGNAQYWVYVGEFVQPGSDLRDLKIPWQNDGLVGARPIDTEAKNFTGVYGIVVDQTDYDNLFVITPRLLNLNQDYYFRWWAYKQR